MAAPLPIILEPVGMKAPPILVRALAVAFDPVDRAKAPLVGT